MHRFQIAHATKVKPLILSAYLKFSTDLLVPHLTIPTRITTTSKILIDNIFSNNLDFTNAKSGNITRVLTTLENLEITWDIQPFQKCKFQKFLQSWWRILKNILSEKSFSAKK